MFDLIPLINGVENSEFFWAMFRYIQLAILGGAITFVYRLYVTSAKKGTSFSFIEFFKGDAKNLTIGIVLGVLIVIAAFLTGFLDIEFNNVHNALAISLGSGVDGAVSYYFDNIIKTKRPD